MPTLISNSRTISAISQTVVLDVRDAHYASITVVGTFVATLTFEISNDQTSWFPINVTPSASATPASTATAAGGFSINVQPWAYLRANSTAYTSGSPVVTVSALPVAGL